MWKRFEWTGKAKERDENDELDPKSWTMVLVRVLVRLYWEFFFLSTFLKKTKSCLEIVHVCTVHLHRQWKQGWLKRGWHSSRPSFVWLVVVRALHRRNPNLLSSLLRFPPLLLPPAILFEVTAQQDLWLCPRSHHTALWAEMLCWKLLVAKVTALTEKMWPENVAQLSDGEGVYICL